MKSGNTSSIGFKLYVFIIITVLGVALGTAFLAFEISANQIDRYYKQVTLDSAINFASLVDGDYLAKLRPVVESDEFQELRETAEETDDESLIKEYLEKNGLWAGYEETRSDLVKYLRNMDAIKYLYIIAIGDVDATEDMYLIDDDETPLYETGYYEEREAGLQGLDASQTIEPTISTGNWGWLCSAYAPVYDSDGNLVCSVGCDFGMDDVMAERRRALLYIVLAAVGLTALVLVVAIVFINKIAIKPLNSLTSEMKRFTPKRTEDYEEAGVANLNLKSDDEIHELYDGIRSMQINIIDYLNDLDVLQKDKERAQEDIKTRDERIGQISREAYRDTLTGVGSKLAYTNKAEELNALIAEGDHDLAVVMVDMNNLKGVNDMYGHRNGDLYIQGCCHLICETFKHSPVYRIGGDEFVAILQGADYERRHELVRQLKDSYRDAANLETAKPWQRYSAAVGMAELASDDVTLDLVFKRADKAMYKDKRRIKEGQSDNR